MASFILVVVECKEQNKLEPKMEKMGLIYSRAVNDLFLFPQSPSPAYLNT